MTEYDTRPATRKRKFARYSPAPVQAAKKGLAIAALHEYEVAEG